MYDVMYADVQLGMWWRRMLHPNDLDLVMMRALVELDINPTIRAYVVEDGLIVPVHKGGYNLGDLTAAVGAALQALQEFAALMSAWFTAAHARVYGVVAASPAAIEEKA